MIWHALTVHMLYTYITKGHITFGRFILYWYTIGVSIYMTQIIWVQPKHLYPDGSHNINWLRHSNNFKSRERCMCHADCFTIHMWSGYICTPDLTSSDRQSDHFLKKINRARFALARTDSIRSVSGSIYNKPPYRRAASVPLHLMAKTTGSTKGQYTYQLIRMLHI